MLVKIVGRVYKFSSHNRHIFISIFPISESSILPLIPTTKSTDKTFSFSVQRLHAFTAGGLFSVGKKI